MTLSAQLLTRKRTSNAKPLDQKDITPLIELEIETALRLVWKREIEENLTGLSFEEWLIIGNENKILERWIKVPKF
jgi:hypothetical protein